MLSIHCPSCGASIIFDESKQIPTFCSFCGAHLPDMTNYVQEALKLKLDKEFLNLDEQRHSMEMETINRQIQKEKIVRSKNPFEYILAFMALLIVILAFVFLFSRNK